MAASKALDVHIVAKHVRQRSQKDPAALKNPKKKLEISLEERQIILDAANYPSLFTPSPQLHDAVNEDEDSDSEDPRNSADGNPSMNLWGEFRDGGFEDEEIGAFFKETDHTSVNTSARVSKDMREPNEVDSDKFKEIAGAVEQPFSSHNDRAFPQEAIKLRGFRKH
ncbi:hypothetical protein GN244_ATG07922 [Phytophthora infestans]|uniref:Uncharacterized protein n=1 Tax=Phytophthora infestans TaxID=4787 RepID=A0A833SW05_PHYIN|nr:hypothetical protein GN244_ATG07922 [Phytophthora infestans]